MSNWDPDSGDPLSAPPIAVSQVEKTSSQIWAEFLSGWFDGDLHQLRGVEARMPQATITFQDQVITKEMEGLRIQVSLDAEDSATRRFCSGDQWYVFHEVTIHFFFRALVKTARADGHNTASLIRWGADTLFAILTNHQHCAVLNWLGMMRFRPAPQRNIGGSGTGAMREVCLECQYVYPADENLTAPVVNTSAPRSVYFGPNQKVRTTPTGLEILGENGNWYAIVAVDDGVPALTVEQSGG